MLNPTDNEVMLQVREGDVGRLGILFERHHGNLFRFLVRLTDNAETGQDLTQEVFLRILRYRHTFRGDAPFTAWMYRLARNVTADYFRKRKSGESLDTVRNTLPDDAGSPHSLLEEVEQKSLLQLALSRLPEEKREVLILSRFQGLKYEEIAGILECPVGTVKARVHFALKELRDIYLNLSEEAVL